MSESNGQALLALKLTGASTLLAFIFWCLLLNLLWMPYLPELRSTGWIRVGDVDASYILAFGPWIVGVIFLLVFTALADVQTKFGKLPLWVRLTLGGGVPAILVFWLLHYKNLAVWNHPGTAISVFLAACVSMVWFDLRRRAT